MITTGAESRPNYLVFGAAFVFVASSAALSSVFTRMSARSDWYACIRPRFSPPPVVFGAVWTFLYVLLVVALTTEAGRGARLSSLLLVALLLLNVLWCYLYFTARQVILAAAVLILIAGTALYTLYVLCRKDTGKLITAVCVAPYTAWVCFAALLNIASIPRIRVCGYGG